MDIETIIGELEQKRDRIDQAITSLKGLTQPVTLENQHLEVLRLGVAVG